MSLNKTYNTIVGGVEYIDEGARILKEGGLVAFPTETVYGLGADAFNERAVLSIFEAKGRPQDNPLIVHFASVEDVKMAVSHIPDVAYKLWEEFSPGPLTLVLPKNDRLPLVTTAGIKTVGIRIPNHPVALELIKKSGTGIAAPSANTSGRVSPTLSAHVYEDMVGKIPLILEGGQTDIGIESTVLDLTKDTPIVLRPGAVTIEMLANVLGKVINHKGEVVVAEAPGMKYKHYAPICPCVGAKSVESALKVYAENDGAVIVGRDSFLKDIPAGIKTRSLGESPKECMRSVFTLLRELEKEYKYIIIEDFSDKQEYYALYNRLKKTTGGVVC
ncbi:MAG: threonylcarbamoyl-AMP synthase [Clostridia bacterium]|nr:threonylcarbamoyl-AMP synthase [Clostridia bacterium]